MTTWKKRPDQIEESPPVQIGEKLHDPEDEKSAIQRHPINQRFGSRSMTLGRWLGAIAIIGSLLVFGESWYTLFVFEFVVIYICSEVLIGYLPWPLSEAMKRNCIRQDGSWSRKRENTELRAIEKLRWDVRVVLLLVLIPTTLLIYLVNDRVVPLNLGFSGISSMVSSDTASRGSLDLEKAKFNKWLKINSPNPSVHKRVLKDYWLIALVGGLIWFVGCCVAVKQTYLYQLKEFAVRIRRRGLEYIQYDRSNAF